MKTMTREISKRLLSLVLGVIIAFTLMPNLSFNVKAEEQTTVAKIKTDVECYIVLDDNQDLRWNVDGLGEKNADLHLNNSEGKNCVFKFYPVTEDNSPTDYYGISFIRSNGIDRYVDVKGESTKENAILHLWSDDNCDEYHQQFKFYYQGTNDAGEMLYYIQVRKSGLWLGVHNNPSDIKIGNQIAQVRESNRKLWRIKYGNGQAGENLDFSSDVHITVTNDLSLRWNADNTANFNDAIHLDGLNGSNCKFRLVPTGDGFYGIKHRGYNNGDYFVDVEDNDNNVNKILHLWSPDDFSGLNHQFSFHEAGINEDTGLMMYYIQARHSGLWIGTQNNVTPGSETNLAQVEKSNRLAFYITNVSSTAEEDDRVHYWDNINLSKWMSSLKDDIKISDINMPGTHDSTTQYVGAQIWGASCQNKNIREQLNMGIRYFDMRLTKADEGPYYNLCHGDLNCYYNSYYGDILQFEKHVLNEWVYPFLKENPTETVVLCVKEDRGETDNADKYMSNILKQVIDKNRDLWYTENDNPELSEVRGKIVLASRLKNTVTGYGGLAFSGWQSEDLYISDVNGTVKSYIQDEYCGGRYTFSHSAKWNTYKSVLNLCELGMIGKDGIIINHSSANNMENRAEWGPKYYSEYIYPKIENYDFQYGVKYGWQIWDFPTVKMARNLISSNNYASNVKLNVEMQNSGIQVDFELTDLGKQDNTGRKILFELYKDEETDTLIKSYSHTMTENKLKDFVLFGHKNDTIQLESGNYYYIAIYEAETAGVSASNMKKIKFKYEPKMGTGTLNPDNELTATISGNAVYGETLTANLSGTDSTTLYYLWLVDGFRTNPITENNTYILSESDIGKKISVQIFSEEDNANKTSEETNVVEKANGIIPNIPTLKAKTENSITLNIVEEQEYKLDDGDWQDSEEFTGLEANTEYSLYARTKENSTHKHSEVSQALKVTTNVIPTVETSPTIENDNNQDSSTPETGDNCNIMIYLVFAVICLGGIGFVVSKRKIAR